MTDYDYDVGVLGGGAAGLTMASGSAQLGAKVILIEKEGRLGGDCLHYGCVPSKTLIRSAKVYHLMKNGPAFGLPAAEVPPVDFRRIRQRIESVIARIQQHDSVERFCGLGAEVVFGAGRFVDDHTVDTGDRRVTAKHWLVATGSSPASPPVAGLDKTPHLTNKEIFHLDRLPGDLIVLGAGPIAVEMAQAFNRLGTKVTVVQRSGQILSKEDRDLADLVMGALRSEGVEVMLNTATLTARDLGGRRELTVKNGDGVEVRLEADAILAALGRSPNTRDLNLEAAGVEHDRRGIAVDERLRTTQKHIYAAGDVTGAYQFTHAAGYEGGIALANIIFRLPRKTDYTWLPWCTYTEPELASIGMNEKAAQKAGIAYRVWTEEFRDNDRGLAEGAEVGRIKMLVDKSEKPIGVQIAGPSAGELISEWVAVLNGKVKMSTLASAVHPYPTLGEINKRVAGDLLSPKLYSPTVKKGLKFFFHLKGRACGLEGTD